TDVATLRPIERHEVEQLAATEYARLVDQLRSLDPDDWAKRTDCPLWDVRAMAGHCVGAMSDFISLRSVARRARAAGRAAKRSGAPVVDEMTASQVADHAELTTEELLARAESAGPRAARWRATAPGLFRRMPIDESVGGVPETWRMGYLLDTILTRDPWMHRVDIARATGRAMTLTADHDGRIVADVVAEWARRHGRPFTLALTGPAGGEFVAGDGSGERITIDAVEFCRTLAGRATGAGLLTQEVPF
ncbi:MAG: maleylpyruvate isomerase family mycothiol-dependent enzyme, partial [Acidimicrobiia bacterium]